MVKNTLLCKLVVALLLLGAATGLRAQQQIADKVVAVVGNSQILYSDVVDLSRQLVQQRREMGYTSDRDPLNEALEQLLLQKLLYNQAQIDSVDVSTGHIAAMVDEELQGMIEKAGSIGALEAEQHRAVFDTREALQQRYNEMAYAQSMQREVTDKVKITPGEVERYYRTHDKDSLPIIPEQYVYAQIVRYPSSMTEAKQRTRQRLLEMRERVISQNADFATLARMYSEDPSRVRGGEMDPATLRMFLKPFADALEKLRPGQISEVVETEYGFHIIQLLDKQGNNYHVRHILLHPFYTIEELAEGDHLLDSLVQKIRQDSITFEQAALRYSQDPYSRQNGGLVSNHDLLETSQNFDAKMTQTRFTRESLGFTRSGVDDYNAIRRMEPGEVSAVYQSTDLKSNQLSKVVKLIEVIPAHNASLNDDYLFLEEYALQEKQEREFLRWLDEHIDAMYIRIDPAFRDGEFQNKKWVK